MTLKRLTVFTIGALAGSMAVLTVHGQARLRVGMGLALVAVVGGAARVIGAMSHDAGLDPIIPVRRRQVPPGTFSIPAPRTSSDTAAAPIGAKP